jgi:hypothetical protein
MYIDDFCEGHDACPAGHKWAKSTGCQFMEEIWLRTDLRPDWRVWVATREGVLTGRELRIFACHCARMVWDHMPHPASRSAVLTAERFAIGRASVVERQAALDQAYYVLPSGSDVKANYATYVARITCASDATRAAKCASSVCGNIFAAHETMSQWLRLNTEPQF